MNELLTRMARRATRTRRNLRDAGRNLSRWEDDARDLYDVIEHATGRRVQDFTDIRNLVIELAVRGHATPQAQADASQVTRAIRAARAEPRDDDPHMSWPTIGAVLAHRIGELEQQLRDRQPTPDLEAILNDPTWGANRDERMAAYRTHRMMMREPV